MSKYDLDALLQGELDDTLTEDERAGLARMISESSQARDRAAEFKQLAGLIESLGPATPPPGLVEHVLAQVSHRPYAVRPSTFERGVTVNKKLLFGLAAAAAIVLAVITYNSYPRATEGTEATIGAAQRAQAPQIAAQDVKLGDTSAQAVLQTETFDAIMKDDAVRTMLQNAEMRVLLQNEMLQKALQDEAILRAIKSPNLVRILADPAVKGAYSAELLNKLDDANMKVLLSNKAFVDALQSRAFREILARNYAAAALTSTAFQTALADKGFDAAIRNPQFVAQLSNR